MRKLATVQLIRDIRPIENADKIEVADVLGWHVVVKKGEFKIGDKCVYCEIDSIMPEDNDEFEFLRNSKGKMQRIRTVKLRGQVSQGIIFPLSILPANTSTEVGEDVTDVLGVTKYEPVPFYVQMTNKKRKALRKHRWIPDCIVNLLEKILPDELFIEMFYRKDFLPFPSDIPKTDETRVQVLQDLLTEHKGTMCYTSEKVDGASLTVFLKEGKLHVCSRNLELVEDATNPYWSTVREMGIEEKLKANWIPDIVLQGELLGEGIQGNKLGLTGKTIRFYNIWDTNNMRYYSYEDFVGTIAKLGLETVPILDTHFVLIDDIDKLLELAEGYSVINPKVLREGIVIRPLIEKQEFVYGKGLVAGRVSFKAVSQKFLLKYADA